MKAVITTKQASPVAPSITLDDFPDPGPLPPGHVRLKVLASALNQLDLWVGRGVPGLDLTYPRVSGCDACCEVTECAPDVHPTWLGKRVIVNAAVDHPRAPRPEEPPASHVPPNYMLLGEHLSPGFHAEHATAPITQLQTIPDDTDPLKAAAFGLTFLTAWSMLVTKADLKHGQLVLVTGIGGGVALAAMSIARTFNCPVAVTSRHQWKLDKAAALGADCCVLDEGQDFSKDVRAWSNKRGVDVAVDSSGKATHLRALKSLTAGGAYVTPGCTSGPDATTDLARIFWLQLRILGSTMGTASEFAEVTTLLAQKRVDPVIDKVFKPADARAAFERLEAGEQFGKLVIDWR